MSVAALISIKLCLLSCMNEAAALLHWLVFFGQQVVRTDGG